MSARKKKRCGTTKSLLVRPDKSRHGDHGHGPFCQAGHDHARGNFLVKPWPVGMTRTTPMVMLITTPMVMPMPMVMPITMTMGKPMTTPMGANSGAHIIFYKASRHAVRQCIFAVTAEILMRFRLIMASCAGRLALFLCTAPMMGSRDSLKQLIRCCCPIRTEFNADSFYQDAWPG